MMRLSHLLLSRSLQQFVRSSASKNLLSQYSRGQATQNKLTEIQNLSSQNESHPLDESKDDFFGLNELFTVEDLFNARCHYGHKEQLLNPHMRPYIFGKRLGALIIDLNETARLLRYALKITAEIAYRKGIILFILENRQNAHIVENAARECGEFAYCRKWQDKIFTDSQSTFKAVTRLPDLCILFSTLGSFGHHRAVTISARMMIPTIAICDTNSDPTLVTYPVPGNDDTPESIEFYSRLFKTAILKAKEKRPKELENQLDLELELELESDELNSV